MVDLSVWNEDAFLFGDYAYGVSGTSVIFYLWILFYLFCSWQRKYYGKYTSDKKHAERNAGQCDVIIFSDFSVRRSCGFRSYQYYSYKSRSASSLVEPWRSGVYWCVYILYDIKKEKRLSYRRSHLYKICTLQN